MADCPKNKDNKASGSDKKEKTKDEVKFTSIYLSEQVLLKYAIRTKIYIM